MSYGVRSFNLEANVAATLPPAAQYLIVTASRDYGAISIAIGDNNAMFSQWPRGLSIAAPANSRTRIVSPIDQVVTLAFCDDDTQLADSRIIQDIPQFPTKVYNASGTALANVQIVDGLLNTFGIVVYHTSWKWNLGSNNAEIFGRLMSSGETEGFNAVYDNCGFIGPWQQNPFMIQHPNRVFVPPGLDLGYMIDIVGTVRWALSVNYRVLQLPISGAA